MAKKKENSLAVPDKISENKKEIKMPKGKGRGGKGKGTGKCSR